MPIARKPLQLSPGSQPQAKEFIALIKCLWSGTACNGSGDDHQSCDGESCSRRTATRLTRYFHFFEQLCCMYEVSQDSQALQSHDDLLHIIRQLQKNPQSPKRDFIKLCFDLQRQTVTDKDKERAVEIAARLRVMMQAQRPTVSFDAIELDPPLPGWTDGKSLAQFVQGTFPDLGREKPRHGGGDDTEELIRSALTARSLYKRAQVTFEPTDDIRNPLRFDVKLGSVKVFHHVGVLKEMLRSTLNQRDCETVADHLQCGALPRQMALEVIDSIQEVLFPLSDTKSRAILRSLTVRKGFDTECLRVEQGSIRIEDEEEISVVHFGARLAGLYEEMENPTARGRWEVWLQQRSGARYVMLATLIGVIFAVILGMAPLAVSSYQAYIGYQAWQHPVETGS